MDQSAFLRAAGRGATRPRGLAYAPWLPLPDANAPPPFKLRCAAAGDDLVARALAILGRELLVLRARRGPVRRSAR